jgi:prepilin-type N-terminal cleavage/methylation domain-containing protein
MSISTKRGFTLIELLVVIAIIGLLASVVIASLSSARAKGRDARRVADLKSLQLANELYFDATGSYAPTTANLAPTYIAKVPTDPSDSTVQYKYAANAAVANGTPCISYHIGAALESVAGANGVLASDADAAAAAICSGSGADFSGVTTGTGSGACGTAGTATTDTCYDLKP